MAIQYHNTVIYCVSVNYRVSIILANIALFLSNNLSHGSAVGKVLVESTII